MVYQLFPDPLSSVAGDSIEIVHDADSGRDARDKGKIYRSECYSCSCIVPVKKETSMISTFTELGEKRSIPIVSDVGYFVEFLILSHQWKYFFQVLI